MEAVLWFLGVIVYAASFGAACSSLAKKKGYSAYYWTGFLFGVFGLIYVAGLPVCQADCAKPTPAPAQAKCSDLRAHSGAAVSPAISPSGFAFKLCPNCNERNPSNRTTCTSCGEPLPFGK